MPDADIKNLFDQKVRQILDDIYGHETQSIIAARDYLESLRADIIKEIETNADTPFTLARYQALQAAIDTRIAQFEHEIVAKLDASISTSFDFGVALIDEPLRVAGFQPSLAAIGRETAQVIARFSAELITEVSDDIRTSINAILRRTALGGTSFNDAITEVGESLESKGIFKSITARAGSIVRTEVLRIQSISAQARMAANADIVGRAGYQLTKVWGATDDERTREDHANADGQERAVNEDFEVGGEAASYPRDPRLSARQSVNCRCYSRPTIKKIVA